MELVFAAVLYVPFLKVSVACLQSKEEESIYILSFINIFIFVLLLLPFHLLLSFNTFIFINRTDNTLHFISLNLLFNIFRITIAIIYPFGPNHLIAPIIVFIILYIFITFKQPVAYYHNDTISQHSISWTCFICIFYFAQKVEGDLSLSALHAIVGMVSFGFAMQLMSSIRIKKIL